MKHIHPDDIEMSFKEDYYIKPLLNGFASYTWLQLQKAPQRWKMFNLNIKATMQSVTFEPNVCSSSDGITPQERGGGKICAPGLASFLTSDALFLVQWER